MFSTHLTYPYGFNILVFTVCPLWWTKNIIYVSNVYCKKEHYFYYVLPGSPIYSKFPF